MRSPPLFKLLFVKLDDAFIAHREARQKLSDLASGWRINGLVGSVCIAEDLEQL